MTEILIYTLEDYKNLRTYSTLDNCTIKLMNDLHIGHENPVISKSFYNSIFDANGYDIYVNGYSDYDGVKFNLFPNADYSEFRNINLIVESFIDKGVNGTIAGITTNGYYNKFINCHVIFLEDVTFTSSNISFNGLFYNGYHATINDCSFTGQNFYFDNTNANFYGIGDNSSYGEFTNCNVKIKSVEGEGSNFCGITYSYDAKFTNCHVEGDFINNNPSYGNVGGLDCNGSSTSYTDCSVKGKLQCSTGNIYPMSYGSQCTFERCMFEGEIYGDGPNSSSQMGGLASNGWYCTFIDCHVKATIEGTNCVNGLAGYGGSSIFKDCTFEGELINRVNYDGGPTMGGISSYAQQMENCHVKANVKAGAYRLGGVLGSLSGSSPYSLKHCSFRGSLIGRSDVAENTLSTKVGGIIGEGSYDGLLEQCYVDNATIRYAKYAGGIVGEGQATEIQDCYSKATISDSQYGGFIGNCFVDDDGYTAKAKVTITNSYFSGETEVENPSYGLVGLTDADDIITIESSYFNKDGMGNIQETPIGEPMSNRQLKQEATFKDWDFEETWIILERMTTPKFLSEVAKCNASPM